MFCHMNKMRNITHIIGHKESPGAKWDVFANDNSKITRLKIECTMAAIDFTTISNICCSSSNCTSCSKSTKNEEYLQTHPINS